MENQEQQKPQLDELEQEALKTPKNIGGRPKVSDSEKQLIFEKLVPYLHRGLSVNKACGQSGIPKSTVYDLIQKDEQFAEKINTAKDYMSVLYAGSAVTYFTNISDKIMRRIDLSSEEVNFLKWYGEKARTTREEFGERKEISIVDPEVELKKVLAIMDEVEGEEKKEE